MKKRLLRGDMVVDTSILIEIALATKTGRMLLDNIIDELIKPYTTTLNITETLYIICRILNLDEAKKRLRLIIDSGYFKIISSNKVGMYVAECKCMFPISIVDCHTLALARRYGLPALFYRLEKGFKPIRERLEEWIGNKIYFIVEE